MKKRIVSIALVVALVAIAAVGSLAYFTDTTDEVKNEFTVGNVDIDLTEPNWDEEAAKSATPNQEITKDPTVTVADTSEDCWVRVNVVIPDISAFKLPDGTVDLTTYFKGFVDNDWELASADITDNKATYAYYHKEIMKAKESATLFTSVIVPDLVEDATGFEIDVTAYAVQAEGFDTAAEAFEEAGL